MSLAVVPQTTPHVSPSNIRRAMTMCSSTRYLMLFVYLPVSFKDEFVRYVGRIIPCLLRGLSDVEDGVRSTAMRAAAGIITHFSQTSVELLLPELERGLVDPSWLIRESSVKLLGELMYVVLYLDIVPCWWY